MTDRRRRASGKRQRGGRARDDDRPRGYEPTRMQRLWRDIDQSRDKLGLGRSQAEGNGTGWGWGAWIEWASGVLGEAGALPGHVREVLEQVPGVQACRTVTDGALGLVRKVPIVGALVPGSSSRSDPDDAT